MELYIKKGQEKSAELILRGREYNELESTEKKKLGKLRDFKKLKEEFLDYLAYPEKKPTQEEWAKERGIAPITVTIWKKDKEFRNELQERLETYLGDNVSRVYKALINKAKTGDVNAIRLFLAQIRMLKSEDSSKAGPINIQFINSVPRVDSIKRLKQTGDNSFEVRDE